MHCLREFCTKVSLLRFLEYMYENVLAKTDKTQIAKGYLCRK